jgi:stage II sporulation protein P
MRNRRVGYRSRIRSGRQIGRLRPGGIRAAVLTFLFWAVSGLIMVGFLHGGPAHLIEAKSEEVGKLYIGSVFPTVSRGSEYEARDAVGTSLEPGAEEPKGILDAKQSASMFESMIGSMFPAAEVLDDDLAEEDPGIIFDEGSNESDSQQTGDSGSDDVKTQDSTPEASTADIDYSKPVVIIYHTHATESYQPVSDGNFHSLKEYGTVREVGDELTKELEAKGIQVIHDKTIHDSPSYNQSYTRSLETVKRLMSGNESTKLVIIDLHRDAAAYSGNTAKTTEIKKHTVAKYNLVIGTGNPNVEALRQFAGKVNNTAEAMYPGFGGKIIEKQYKFNQYVSNYHMLLEVGNNQNTIEQAKLTGKYFADVLADVIKDMN